jgi:hypothetical protein
MNHPGVFPDSIVCDGLYRSLIQLVGTEVGGWRSNVANRDRCRTGGLIQVAETTVGEEDATQILGTAVRMASTPGSRDRCKVSDLFGTEPAPSALSSHQSLPSRGHSLSPCTTVPVAAL